MKNVYLLIIILISCFTGCSRKKPETKAPVPRVKVAVAKSQRIPVALDAIGNFTAYNSADIKAQVEGRLEKIHFTQGDEVKEGQLLFTIDPRPFEAKRDDAIARRDQNIARAYYAEEKVSRYRVLLPERYVAELDYIQYKSNLDYYTAAVKEAEAEIRLANINLEYCYIKAPFTGLTSKKMIDIGNLITNNGDTLTIINQLDPIYIDFSIPERDFFKLREYYTKDNLYVQCRFPDYPDHPFCAKLILIDNSIQKQVGMVPLRAEIRNPRKMFWPGQFIRSQLILTHIDDAILIPQSALTIGQKGRFVYVVKDDKVEYRAIEVGETLGSCVQIVKGVHPGEHVVTEGQINLLPNILVQIASVEAY